MEQPLEIKKEDFDLQLLSLEHLLAAGEDCHAAVMVSFSLAKFSGKSAVSV